MPPATLLDDAAAQALDEVGGADIVVGIPSYHTERTIGHVVKAIQYGLAKYYPSSKAVVVVSDGGSGDGTRESAHRAALYPDFDTMLIRQPTQAARVVVAQYKGPGGKGSALRAVFEASHHLGAKACVTVDADLRSITPEWLEVLAGPLLLKGYDFVAPQYARHKYDGTITNMMVYPLTRALYGSRIRQPIGGDFGLGPRMVQAALQHDVWATDVARFGIDIWLTTLAVTEGYRICQGNLGAKVHDAKDPRQHLGPMAVQVMGTVFRLTGDHAAQWMPVKGSKPVRSFGFKAEVAPTPVSVDPLPMVETFRQGWAQDRQGFAPLLTPLAVDGLDASARLDAPHFRLPPTLWARVMYDLAAAHAHLVRKEPERAAWLVDHLVPLYLGRTASFVLETADLSTMDAERVVEEQAEVFEAAKPHLRERWEELGLGEKA
jgi:glucosylglycerate synthase